MLVEASLLLASLTQSPAKQAACADPISRSTNSAGVQICLAEEQVRLANNARDDGAERRRLLERAAAYYRNAVNQTSDHQTKRQALDALAQLYDVPDLNELPQREAVLRELVTLLPDEVSLLYRLAKVQEDQGLWDLAESTLMWARQKRPEEAEPYKMLGYFFERRAAALTPTREPTYEIFVPGEPDENGVYRIWHGVRSPQRVSPSPYTEVVRMVSVEIVIDANGAVTEARPVSVGVRQGDKIDPRLVQMSEAAVQDVRKWRYAPALVDGRPVPVKMTVLVPPR